MENKALLKWGEESWVVSNLSKVPVTFVTSHRVTLQINDFWDAHGQLVEAQY